MVSIAIDALAVVAPPTAVVDGVGETTEVLTADAIVVAIVVSVVLAASGPERHANAALWKLSVRRTSFQR